MEAFYYACGEFDAYLIVDVPTATAGLALSLTVNASGAARPQTIPLLTPDEIESASTRTVQCRALVS